jgi:hypothetical protein
MKIRINILWLIIPAALGLALLLLTDHRQHVLDFLPFLILLACPLIPLHASRAWRPRPNNLGSGLTLTSCQGAEAPNQVSER